jgi:hypothetical protein
LDFTHQPVENNRMRSTLAALALCCSALISGCFQWTQNPQGNVQSVGVAGTTVWQSKSASKPITPADLGIPADQAAKMGGPVLVIPADSSNPQYRYRFYYANNNQCSADLAKQLVVRSQQNISGPAPFCSENPPQPSLQGHGLLF